jgi:aconitase B
LKVKIELEVRIPGLLERLDALMSVAQDLKDAIAEVSAKADALKSGLDGVKASVDAEIVRVEALIAAGGVVSQADLDAAVTALRAISVKADDAIAEAAAIGSEADAERP